MIARDKSTLRLYPGRVSAAISFAEKSLGERNDDLNIAYGEEAGLSVGKRSLKPIFVDFRTETDHLPFFEIQFSYIFRFEVE